MTYLVLILALQTPNSDPVAVTLPLNVDVATCEKRSVPEAKKKYVHSALKVISAQCFSSE